MKKVNVVNWLSEEDIEKMELLKEFVGIDDIPMQLINFDRVFLYDDTTKYELGKEVASGLGVIDEENLYNKYFDYEKLADDLLNEDGSRYFTIKEDSEYLYIDDLCNADDGIVIGKMKTDFAEGQFVKLAKHEWACGWYWSYNHISNNGLSCGLENYLKLSLVDAFENTWITEKIWDKYRLLMLECGEVLGKKSKIEIKALEDKLNNAWNYLMCEYQKIDFIMEFEDE
ncbi:MAG: hypothetical protein U9Q66_00430 [Patescibacteria group bacterium]|nr:hypothetical protein [Patescibacteria group bacterium]